MFWIHHHRCVPDQNIPDSVALNDCNKFLLLCSVWICKSKLLVIEAALKEVFNTIISVLQDLLLQW